MGVGWTMVPKDPFPDDLEVQATKGQRPGWHHRGGIASGVLQDALNLNVLCWLP